ncbi:MAG: sigma-70 family RNA polymerase sigma factor [Chitinophagaceae bacterium]|nr:sigma-70 family RNA polymerase sigma factor [Chitinophagaceae bacterium]
MPTTVLLNEKELLLQVANGDQEAYKKIFIYYWSQIFSTALLFTKSRELAQDLTQDIFAHIWIKRERLAEVENFEGFLFITSRNLIVDKLRKKVFTTQNEAHLCKYFEEENQLSPYFQIELKEMTEIIHQGISVLPERQRVAFYLSRFKGLRHKEIAAKMGISQESVKSHIVRAIGNLRKYLADHSNALPFFICWFFL